MPSTGRYTLHSNATATPCRGLSLTSWVGSPESGSKAGSHLCFAQQWALNARKPQGLKLPLLLLLLILPVVNYNVQNVSIC